MLKYKPNYDEATKRWEHFWKGEMWKRPVLLAAVSRNGVALENPFRQRYYRAVTGRWDETLALLDTYFENMLYLGEAMPGFTPDFGPDQCAAFLGAELHFSEESRQTNWVEPIIEDWAAALPLRLDPKNPTFQRFLDYAGRIAAHGEGRYLVQCIDMHSNADALSALRGPERFCMDLMDCPEMIDQAMLDVRKTYRPMIEAHRRIAGAEKNGCCQGWIWHPRSFQYVQADVICMLSPPQVRRFVLPALEEEIALHERSYFHLDGPGALRHIDDILSLKFDVLQWQPGSGTKENWQWLDVLKKGQAAGKALDVFGEGLTPGVVRELHRELDPARVMYRPVVKSVEEFDALATWLEKNS